MTRNYRIGILASAFIAALFSAPLQAQTFRLYAGIAPTNYKISFDGNGPGTGVSGVTYANRTGKSSYLAGNVGMTWVSPLGVYIDFSAQQSLAAKHDLWSDVASDKQDFSRDAYTLTAGYARAFGPGLTVSGFVGAIVSRTELDAPKPPFAFSKDKFDSQGGFVGVGAGIPALGGQFSGSVAIAYMSGKWKDDNGFNNSADYTFGFSVGGAYTYKLSQSWGVTADARFQQYNYDFGTQSTTTAYTVKEQISSLGVRLGYQF